MSKQTSIMVGIAHNKREKQYFHNIFKTIASEHFYQSSSGLRN
ncbi:hypothetical protein [Nostoc sp. UHCC 0302]